MTNETTYLVGSLFSGIGGIELGLERAGGFETAWFVECDPHAQAILRKHWPNAAIYGDVTTLDFARVPRVDILTGGFPCQDISNAGKRAGITGSRSSLWKHYLRAISALRPKLIIAENVAALTGRGLNVVLADLAEIGYDAEWHCIPTAAIGTNFQGDRIFIIATPYSSKYIRERKSITTDKNTSNRQTTETHQTWYRGIDELEPMGIAFRISSYSDALRVLHGIPARMDRLARLGNAVVPQVAQAIGEAIIETGGLE